MELAKNMVILDVKEYNDLRDYVNNIENGKVFFELKTERICNGMGFDQTKLTPVYKAKEDTIKEISDTIDRFNKDLQERFNRVCQEYSDYQRTHTVEDVKLKDKTIDDVKRMSVKEFKKWKKEN